MLLDSHEAEAHQLAEEVEFLRVDPSEHLNHLARELERSLLKLDALTRCVAEEEPEIDMHDVSLDIDQDVPVVPVLDLQYVAY